jgi:hypothetical protein
MTYTKDPEYLHGTIPTFPNRGFPHVRWFLGRCVPFWAQQSTRAEMRDQMQLRAVPTDAPTRKVLTIACFFSPRRECHQGFGESDDDCIISVGDAIICVLQEAQRRRAACCIGLKRRQLSSKKSQAPDLQRWGRDSLRVSVPPRKKTPSF